MMLGKLMSHMKTLLDTYPKVLNKLVLLLMRYQICILIQESGVAWGCSVDYILLLTCQIIWHALYHVWLFVQLSQYHLLKLAAALKSLRQSSFSLPNHHLFILNLRCQRFSLGSSACALLLRYGRFQINMNIISRWHRNLKLWIKMTEVIYG